MAQHLSVTARGASHVQRGLPCQDASASITLDRHACLLVVADGAGSAPRSDVGAHRAIELVAERAALRWVGVDLSSDGLRGFLVGLLSEVATVFHQLIGSDPRMLGGSPADYATTLAATVVAWPWIAYGGIGDAFLVGCDPDEHLHLLVPPSKDGEFRNETQFLDPRASIACRVILDESLSGVVLSTDGLEKFIEERVVTESNGTRQPVMWSPSRSFAGLLAAARNGTDPEQLAARFTGEDFQKRKGDDIGVSVAWK
jgi:hypothetical protein